MAAPRYLVRLAGRWKQVVAILTSAGAADAEKIPATNASGVLDPTLLNATNSSAGAADANKIGQLDGTGRFSSTMMPVGVVADTQNAVASEALAAGDLVNLWNNAGTVNARKADATAEGKEIHGFVLSAFALSATALVYGEGKITGLTGLTPGAYYYLSAATPGALAAAPPSAEGNVDQIAGWAADATTLNFEPGEPVTIA